jgi:hypothetical protein
MESNDESQAQPEAPTVRQHGSRKPLWRVAGATVLIGSLTAGAFAISQGGSGSAASASASSGVVASQVASTAQSTPVSGAKHGFRGGQGQGFGNMAGRFGGGLTVSGVSGDTITATGRGNQTITITVTGATKYTEAGAAATIADVVSGTKIAVQGTHSTAAAETATSIEILLPTEGGVVTAVSGSTLTIKGFDGSSHAVTLGASTRYQRDGQSASESDISAGASIMAEGTTAADGSLHAMLVNIQTPRLMGQVTAVNSGTYTITGRMGSAGSETVTTSSSTVYVNASGATVQALTISTGTRIIAEGTLSADGKTLAATRITVVPAGTANYGRGGHFPGGKAGPTATPATTTTAAGSGV